MFQHTLNREKGRDLKIISQFWTFRYTGVRYSDILLYWRSLQRHFTVHSISLGSMTVSCRVCRMSSGDWPNWMSIYLPIGVELVQRMVRLILPPTKVMHCPLYEFDPYRDVDWYPIRPVHLEHFTHMAWDPHTTKGYIMYLPEIYPHTGYTAAIIWQSFDVEISSSTLGHVIYIVTTFIVLTKPDDGHE